jgi:peptidoglycan/LPS O-acetylase OafA/YrhL
MRRLTIESRIGSYRPELDGIRAVAALAVVAFHINRFAPGFLGVDVFFVLSGYLITRLLRKGFAAKESLSRFYKRRFFRLFPILLVNVVVVSTILYFISYQHNVEYPLRAVFYLRNILTTTHSGEDLWTHTWSLASEQQYYLIFPPILLFLSRRISNLNNLAALFIGTFFFLQVLNQFQFADKYPVILSVIIRCSGLWLGCSLGILEKFQVMNFPKIRIVLNLAWIISLVAALLMQSTFWVSLATYFMLVLFEIPTKKQTKLALINVLSWQPLPYLGKISYSMYMWHPIVVFLVFAYVDAASFQRALIFFAALFLVSALSFHFVESPATKYLSGKFLRG